MRMDPALTAGGILKTLEEKRSAHDRLKQRLGQNELVEGLRTGVHIDRDRELIELAVQRGHGWEVLSHIGSVTLQEYPALCDSRISGFLAI